MLYEILDGVAALLVLLVLGLLLSIRQWPEWLHRARSAMWQTIPGMAEGGEVSTFHGRSIDTSTATIAYSYRVDDTYYSGYHTETFNDEQKAWSYVDSLKGRQVQVSYNPRKPEVSVIRRQHLLG
jgi:hypothetical protein